MILFQRKIIYMGYAPPGARAETINPSDPLLQRMKWEEIDLESEEGVCLKGMVLQKQKQSTRASAPTIILYLQGNAGNTLHRLPVFEKLLNTTKTSDVAIFAVAPRSYWLSSSRTPSEKGFLQDYRSALLYAAKRWPHSPLVLYGHSLGGSVAVCLLSTLKLEPETRRIKGLILENAFISVPEMVRTLYPYRWLPYYHLGPFVWDRWDVLRAIKEAGKESLLRRIGQGMLIINSEKDEIVPLWMGDAMCNTVKASFRDTSGRPPTRRVIIPTALHENAWRRREWSVAVGAYLDECAEKDRNDS
ncbi:hypothetical protein BOTBODRAFT_26993 [Botryobasidium botryosum FD-172 SS1]|uniref:Serine aminopeptidase S33 domain-containing protein n=1 Tax=Botryobasidium botryosum (strain FD-172 SS1) TaxID=930990 RepID=A0A067MZ05_BOTB1|nr:hypothetical protein BOTBODRAFT_26993 [Botryobasidium botryosum FD-172 SS1]